MAEVVRPLQDATQHGCYGNARHTRPKATAARDPVSTPNPVGVCVCVCDEPLGSVGIHPPATICKGTEKIKGQTKSEKKG